MVTANQFSVCYHSTVFTQEEQLDEEKETKEHREEKYTAEKFKFDKEQDNNCFSLL